MGRMMKLSVGLLSSKPLLLALTALPASASVSASAISGYWTPPNDKPGLTCDFKKIKVPGQGEYACITLGQSICRDNGGNFGTWWFGVDEVTTDYTAPDGTVITTKDTFPVLIDPATNRYAITGSTYHYEDTQGDQKICKDDDGEAQRDGNYAGTTHICIGEVDEFDPGRFSDERPYLFFYNEKTHTFPYQLVCDGIGAEDRLPMMKMVNNEDIAQDMYIDYPVDIVKFKKVSTTTYIDFNYFHSTDAAIFTHV